MTSGIAGGDVRIKRVYDEPSDDDGYRILVDRLWPRGLTRERAAADLWLKEVAPSPGLRRDWHHDPDRMAEFAERYRDELAANPALEELREIVGARPVVTLLYGAKDPEVNHARILQDYLGSA